MQAPTLDPFLDPNIAQHLQEQNAAVQQQNLELQAQVTAMNLQITRVLEELKG